MVKRNKKGELVFLDNPEFTPNLTPREIFQLGSFGGTYWRPIYSSVTKKNYKNIHHNYPKLWWEGIPEKHLSSSTYDVKVNKYRKKVGSTLEDWESRSWITEYNPYGWVHWYCDYYNGRRTPDDNRQIMRWLNFAGPKGRFKNRLINMVKSKREKGIDTSHDDYSVSPAIRQSLQHWAYQLTEEDCK